MKGWVSNTIATAPRWPSMAPHRGASGRATSVYSTPWPPACSGAFPTWCTIEVPLASLHHGCCNPGCPRAPKPYVHPSAQRKAQGSHSRSGGFTAMVCGKFLNTQPGTLYNMHLSVTRSEGANYHSKGNSTLSRRTATWCCSLAPLVPPTVLGQ